MHIGQEVRTNDGKEGKVYHLDYSGPYRIWCVRCGDNLNRAYLEDQLTPVEPEKPEGQCKVPPTTRCAFPAGSRFCRNSCDHWYAPSHSYAQRLEWTWGWGECPHLGECEYTGRYPFCGTSSDCKLNFKKPEEPKLYICDHAKECNTPGCNHKQPHAIENRCNEVTCFAHGASHKCIPCEEKDGYGCLHGPAIFCPWWGNGQCWCKGSCDHKIPKPEERDWFVVKTGEIEEVIACRCTEAQARYTARGGYRAFKWSDGQ